MTDRHTRGQRVRLPMTLWRYDDGNLIDLASKVDDRIELLYSAIEGAVFARRL